VNTIFATPAFLFLTLAASALAGEPVKRSQGYYSSLYTDSPFTTKPPPTAAGPMNNPLEDYALIGVSPIGKVDNADAYRVTLLNKKQPDERITVSSGDAKSDFKILEVIRKSGDPLGTTVRMSTGSMTGTVSFDEKLLTLATAQPKAPNQNPIPGGPQLQPGMPMPPGVNPPGVPPRQPRPRVIPPPAMPLVPVQPQPGQQAVRPQRRN
jgi:hypothetical protein